VSNPRVIPAWVGGAGGQAGVDDAGDFGGGAVAVRAWRGWAAEEGGVTTCGDPCTRRPPRQVASCGSYAACPARMARWLTQCVWH